MGKKKRHMFNPKFSNYARSRVKKTSEVETPQNEVITAPILKKDEPRVENTSIKEEKTIVVEQAKPTIKKEEPKTPTRRRPAPQPKVAKEKAKKQTTTRSFKKSTKTKRTTKQ